MLEQAVIDAEALKEAAVKNAEQEVLEKYSNEIKDAVDVLLEQPADPFAADDPLGGLGGEEALGGLGDEVDGEEERDEIADELTMKSTEGEKACPCPEEEEIVTLDLTQLSEEINEPVYESSQDDLEELLNNDTKIDLVEEEFDVDEETLKDTIEEILKVDLENVPRGDMGTTHPTKMQQEYAVDVALAADQDTEVSEENKELQKLVGQLQEHVKSLKSEKNRLLKQHKELKSVAKEVGTKLIELNIANAKLGYENHILESPSLNERQKIKLVEAISKANSIQEAKVIFETLKESISLKSKTTPATLREAVSKNNHLVLKSNKKETQASSSAMERMKKLAGII